MSETAVFYPQHALADLAPDARLGVIGNPIAHSKSPQMQHAALAAAGLRGEFSYVRLMAGIEAGEFEAMLQELAQIGFKGLNVTVPFKKKAYAQAEWCDALSSLCEAANTLVRTPTGWRAYNTDGPGFQAAFEEATGQPLAQQNVLIAGACGGAGTAIAAQCALIGCPRLMLVNRPRPELEELQAKLQIVAPQSRVESCHFEQAELAGFHLIVNATSLGLHEGEALPLPVEQLQPQQITCDIVTHPTAFAAAARAQGCTSLDGLGMLLHQGALAFEHWFGIKADTQAMRKALNAAP